MPIIYNKLFYMLIDLGMKKGPTRESKHNSLDHGKTCKK